MKNSLLIFSVICNLFFIFKIESCNTEQVNSNSFESFENETQEFKIKISKDSSTIASQDLLIVENSKELQKLLKKNSDLQKVNQQIKISFENKIKDVIAAYKDSVVFVYGKDSLDKEIEIGILFGTKFSEQNDWYNLSGSILKSGVMFDSVSFNNRLTVSIGNKDKSFFKPLKSTLEVKSDNPYSNINSLNNIQVVDNRKFYEKPAFKFITGFIVGSATMYYINAK
jgi:hypothetical protein